MKKAYEAREVEDEIYQSWEDSGYFTPENLPNKEARKDAFSIVLPPPNVTGTLHMGHAAMLAIEDAIVRYKRLRGFDTLWLPGTDHAAIATQSKVEKIIFAEEGMSRHDLGREAFLARVEAFAQESHDTIVNQMKKMGASVDWSREAYTLDTARNKAVNTAFKKMYEDGLIYRGFRVVNWDPVGQTTISDDELVYKTGTAVLYTFKYDKDFPIAISTTRPETKVGDTAVAVHPEDARYKKFIGKEFKAEFAGTALNIKIIADESVDPNFGTGALGVTPAHSTIDAEIAKRHDLEMIQVINEEARMTETAGTLVKGMTTLEARATVVEWLRGEGLILEEKEVEQNISTAERTGGIVEPLPKMQWFIDVNKPFAFRASKRASIKGLKDGEEVTLKKLMQHVVELNDVSILPDRFNKTYFHWINNLRDWNISRQIWFGHRVPVWYCSNCSSTSSTFVREADASFALKTNAQHEQPKATNVGIFVSLDPLEKCPDCADTNIVQDEDTLDTWFSSGLWTFSTLGWPDDTADFNRYHPTSLLETGYDILFFWVARMILMSTYLVGEVPFETVYLHGLVRDEQGRKMSKSLGNIINPLDMIEQYGADATRLSLLIGASPGNDTKLSEEKIASFRNFTNKLWNISRFVFMSVDDVRHIETMPEPETLADKWILERFAQVSERATKHFDAYDLSLLGEELRNFTWGEFADWYLEVAKIQKADGRERTEEVLLYILERLLVLWHPFMPFVTEEIYKQFNRGMLIVADWPDVAHSGYSESIDAFARLQELVVAVRNLRATYKVEAKKQIQLYIEAGDAFESEKSVIAKLVRAEEVTFGAPPEGKVAKAVVGTMTISVPLEGLLDLDQERARLEKELKEVNDYVNGLQKKLGNSTFVEQAPKQIVNETRKRLEDAEGKKRALEQELSALA